MNTLTEQERSIVTNQLQELITQAEDTGLEVDAVSIALLQEIVATVPNVP